MLATPQIFIAVGKWPKIEKYTRKRDTNGTNMKER